MLLFVGLGNPGLEYKKTRHNAGFMFLDEAIKDFEKEFKLDKKLKGYISIFKIENEAVCFLKPTTFMNLSGESVRLVRNFYNIEIDNIYIIHDDMSFPIGTIKMKTKGSSAGHNGIKSIIENLSSDEFNRIKIGVSRPKNGDVVDYVLGKFSNEDESEIMNVIKNAHDIIKMIALEGYQKTMNHYNQK